MTSVPFVEKRAIDEEVEKLPLSTKQKKCDVQENDVKCTAGGSVPDLTKSLCRDALLKLFSFLQVEDLVSVQRVCHDWRVSAQDISLWNDYTLRLYGIKNHDTRQIITMKAVRGICGEADNCLVDVILENVLHLKRMNCIFNPAITSLQIENLLERFPELESITLDITAPDLIQSIEKLKTSEYLRELHLFCQPEVIQGLSRKTRCNAPDSNVLYLYTVFTDCKNFPALTSLDLSQVMCDDHDSLASIIIGCKSQQLFDLNFEIKKQYSNILDYLNMCTKLRKLDVKLYKRCHVGIMIDRMNWLQSVDICLLEKDNYSFIMDLHDSFINGYWPNLTEVSLCLWSQDGFNILQALIDNVKQLKKLSYNDYKHDTCDDQLKEISSLSKLKSLSLHGFITFSPKSLNDISKLPNLQCISLHGWHYIPYFHNIQYLSQRSMKLRQTLRGCELHHVADMLRPMKMLRNVYFDCGVSVNCINRIQIDKFLSDNPPF